jgi:hypothetical protein
MVKLPIAMLALAFLVEGCATTPMGPTVQVMPGRGKPFDVFAQEQQSCMQYASQMVAGQAQQANTMGAGAAVLGTVLGAGLGAAVGGGRGAAIGAASGAAVGTGVGASGSASAQGGIQGQYDNAYLQCMVAKGNIPPAPPPVLVQPAPYVVQPAPYYAAPPPDYGY